MIPKVIHYCWFGRNPLPESAIKCIASWKKYLPDYKIIEWNEDNFDINIISYTQQAYQAKKYAFVSDYARFWLIYKYGGLYFDTDVEIIRPIDHIIAHGAFMGIEKSLVTKGLAEGFIGVAPGLGIGAEPHNQLYKEIIDFYNHQNFYEETGTVVTNVTQILILHGLKNENNYQVIDDMTIYPDDVFCPMDSTTGLTEITPKTVSIHHYSCSWIDHNTVSFQLHLMKNRLIRILGPKAVMWLSTKLSKRKNNK